MRSGIGLGGLLLAVACGSGPSPSPVPETGQVVVLISIDGFRADYLDRPQASGLRALAALGVRARQLEPVFPTKTFPNHYSIVTGLWPEHHGIVGNTMEDPVLGWFRINDTVAVRDSRWWGGEPLWVTAERQGRRAASLFWPGSEAPIAGLRPSWYTRYQHDLPNDVRVGGVLEWLRLPPDSGPAFVTLYFSVVDDAGHRFGPDAPQTDSAIARVDSAVTALWRGMVASGLERRVNLVIVADHGMASTSADRRIVLDDWLEAGTYRVIDLNPVALIAPAEGREEEVLARLRQAPHLQVYRKSEVPERWHFREHHRITPVVAVADEGWTIATRAMVDRNPGVGNGGTHGYDNRAPSMQALFMAVGPAFPEGRVVDRVRTVDLYQLMARVLGLRPAATDGALDSIRAVLR